MKLFACAATLAALLTLPAIRVAQLHAQTADPASPADTITFSFDRAGLPVPRYTVSVDERGNGRYIATQGTENIDSVLLLTPATTAKLFSLVHDLHIAPGVCASKAKNIADTGTKTLTYATAERSSACIYNFSENKDVQQSTAIFQGIAETMDEGRTLDRLHRYDRLGLDAEMIAFTQEVAAGRALEVGTIAPCLQSIADDSEVIQRVRNAAKKLLAATPGSTGSR